MRHHHVQTETLRQHVLEAGEGPLVILCHGFPELSWSWRAQVEALAAAGYRAVAPDMRGYGGTDKPNRVEDYTLLHLVGDMVALVQALGEKQAVVVGHDWGAPVAWNCALMRPDLFRAVAGLSVPFTPRRVGRPPLETWREIVKSKGLGQFYMLDFQRPGAEAEFEADVRANLTRAFWAYDGTTPDALRSTGFYPEGETFLSAVKGPGERPPWMSSEDLDRYVQAFEAGGFRGPVNWYRNMDRNHELTAWVQDRKIEVPALFLVGEKDPVRNYTGFAEAELKRWVPNLVDKQVLPGAGHWVQQERADEVNAALLGFLRGL
jgi:pimeloyl-ACP methyl ester carboxylesterase